MVSRWGEWWDRQGTIWGPHYPQILPGRIWGQHLQKRGCNNTGGTSWPFKSPWEGQALTMQRCDYKQNFGVLPGHSGMIYVSLDIFATIFKNQYLYKAAMSQFQRIYKQRLFIKVFFLPFQRFPDEISLRENLGRVNLNGKHHSVDSSEILTKNWELLKLYFFNNLIWETFELCKSCLLVIASEQN